MEDSGSAAAASARTMRMQSTSTRRAGGKRLCAILSSEARKFERLNYQKPSMAFWSPTTSAATTPARRLRSRRASASALRIGRRHARVDPVAHGLARALDRVPPAIAQPARRGVVRAGAHITGGLHVHPRRTEPRHPLQIRPPVNLGPQVVRLRPAPHCRSKVISYSLRVEPAKHFINWQQDPFANYQARLVFPEPTTEFKVTVDLVVEMAVYNPFDFFLEPSADNFPFEYEPDAGAGTGALPRHRAADAAGAGLPRQDRPQAAPTIDFLVALNQQVQHDVKYLIRMEPGVQTPEQTLELASGSCRDSGWLLVQLLRRLGLAARFVSGYLIQLKPDVKALDGPSGTEVDFTDLHAWCEVYLPGAGWIGLDPTSGPAGRRRPHPAGLHAAAVGRRADRRRGGRGRGRVRHHMQVTRIHESPRVTKPYTEEQWAEVLALGERSTSSCRPATCA
jgi:transglutaminase-like putative cysteine protease